VKGLLAVGLMWAVLMLAFEFGIGFFVLGYSRQRMLEDYDVSRGGLMGFGILFMVLAPYLATRTRGIHTNKRKSH
jgi:threonine/homoserine/homoserine lactone efflux protein